MVYNLTVDDAHAYYAEGVLVSNCDATIYLLRERPELQKIMDEDPRMAELKEKDFMGWLDARSIRRAMDEHGDSWTPPKGQPTGDAFRGEVGGMEDSLPSDGKIEW